MDHLLLALLRVFMLPEVMHYWRDARQEAQNCQCAYLGFHAQQDACASDREGHARADHRRLGQRHALRRRVLRHQLALLKVVNPVIEKESAEDEASEQKRGFHRNLRIVRLDSRGVRDVARSSRALMSRVILRAGGWTWLEP